MRATTGTFSPQFERASHWSVSGFRTRFWGLGTLWRNSHAEVEKEGGMIEEDWDSPNWQEELPVWVREDRPMTESEWLNARLYDRVWDLEKQVGNNRRLLLFVC